MASLSAQPNLSHHTELPSAVFNHGQAIRFVVIDSHVLPYATSPDITALLTQAKARIVEPVAVSGVLTVAFDITSRDQSLAVLKASPIVKAVDFKTS